MGITLCNVSGRGVIRVGHWERKKEKGKKGKKKRKGRKGLPYLSL